MRRQVMLSVVCGAVVFAVQAAERVPIVAVTPFKQYYDMGKGWERQLGAVRDQVVAELVREYDCVVLNRSFGYSLALEDAVKRLGSIAEQPLAASTLYGADYSFTGIFQQGVTNVECILRIAELAKADSQKASRTVSVGVPSIDASSVSLAREIAKAAGLIRRVAAEKVRAAETPRVWMVLPFNVMTTSKEMAQQSSAFRSEMALRAEKVLQQDRRVRLVDHTALEAALREHARAALDESSGYGSLSKLVGAERVLLGSVGAGKGETLRLTLLAVDAATAQVLGAVSGVSATKASVGDELEKMAQALLAAAREPVVLTAADAALRVREASLYLTTARSDVVARSLTSQMAVIEYAEMAYLISRDNPRVIGDIAKTLSECNNYVTKTPIEVKRLIAEVADKVVAPYPEVANSADVLLARARAHVAGGSYEKAYRLLSQYEKAYPDKIDVYAQQAMGECLLKTGKTREALAEFGDSTYHYRTLQMRVKALRELGDEAAEFELMSTMTQYQLRELLGRYIDLLAKRKGPQAAVDYIQGLLREDQRSIGMRNDIQFQLAKYTLAAGDKKRAAALCQRLLDVGKANNWTYFRVGDSKAFKKKLEEMQAQTGPSDEVWLKAREIQPFPATCALYIQPLGDIETNMLDKARSGVQEFFGARTEILPSIELARDASYYRKESNKYDSFYVIKAVLPRLKVPSDALAVAMVTRENLCDGGYTWVQYKRDNHGILISCFMSQKQAPSLRVRLLRNLLITTISHQLGLRGVYPCIAAGTRDDISALFEKYAYSPEVQPVYAALDLAAEQRKWIDEFRKSGATIVERPSSTPASPVPMPAVLVTDVPAPAVPRPVVKAAVTNKSAPFLVIDLSAGADAKSYPLSYLSDLPAGGWDKTHKTERLVLRRVEPGTFIMGSPLSELGHREDERQRQVTLTRAYYIGVFEVTQRQWELVMGSNPSWFKKDATMRPVEQVSYCMVRGSAAGLNWPADGGVDETSFMGRLRSRTGLAGFDLPTEAQWEYACRAETETALNSAKNLTSCDECLNVQEVAVYRRSRDMSEEWVGPEQGGSATVGSRLPNRWGLYDMHGNVLEWCRDCFGPYVDTSVDPVGAKSGPTRVLRGGPWWYYDSRCAANCRSARRYDKNPRDGGKQYGWGFRVTMTEL